MQFSPSCPFLPTNLDYAAEYLLISLLSTERSSDEFQSCAKMRNLLSLLGLLDSSALAMLMPGLPTGEGP